MNKIQYTILLLSVTLCWSSEMILMKNIPTDVSAFAVLTMTNGIGSIILAMLFAKHIKNNIRKDNLIYAAILAIMNVFYNLLTIYALKFIDSATGSFLISFTIAMVPILMVLMKRKVTKSNVLGIIIMTFGIIISCNISLNREGVKGIVVMLIVCIIRALYIIKMNDYAKKEDSSVLTVLIVSIVAIISFILWFIIEPKTFFALTYSNPMLSSIFADGYFICGYAVLINMIAQKYATPANCSAIYSFQIVFAIILSAVVPDILGDSIALTVPKVIACIVIVIGALISEVDFIYIFKNKWRNKDYEA